MNYVYNIGKFTPLTSSELSDAANEVCVFKVFEASDFTGTTNRISGIHCSCNGNGEFELLPAVHPDCVAGGKRYMKCRICGGVSHL